MLISKITISNDRAIESIELKMNNNLIVYLINEGEPSSDSDGGGSPSYFVSRRVKVINPADIKNDTTIL